MLNVCFNILIWQDDKKHSNSSLDTDEDKRQLKPTPELKTNQERVKENQLRQKLILGATTQEPKCNIEKGRLSIQIVHYC